MVIDAKLHRALHGTFGADRTWADARKKGCTDEELRALIVTELGICGGFTDDQGGASYTGSPLRFWNEGLAWHKKPTLSGQALVDATRRLLRIPMPRTVAQQEELFHAD